MSTFTKYYKTISRKPVCKQSIKGTVKIDLLEEFAINRAVKFVFVIIKYLLVSTTLNNSANPCGNLVTNCHEQINQDLPVM